MRYSHLYREHKKKAVNLLNVNRRRNISDFWKDRENRRGQAMEKINPHEMGNDVTKISDCMTRKALTYACGYLSYYDRGKK